MNQISMDSPVINVALPMFSPLTSLLGITIIILIIILIVIPRIFLPVLQLQEQVDLVQLQPIPPAAVLSGTGRVQGVQQEAPPNHVSESRLFHRPHLALDSLLPGHLTLEVCVTGKVHGMMLLADLHCGHTHTYILY